MAVLIHRKIGRWIFDHLIWDPKGSAREGFWRGVWATRKFFVAIVGATLLTWTEWVKHHPPEIAIVAVIHLVFVLSVIALLVFTGQWFRRGGKTPPGRPAKPSHDV